MTSLPSQSDPEIDPPVIIPGDFVELTKKDVLDEINAQLPNEAQPIPVADFQDTTSPLRLEIEMLLQKITLKMGGVAKSRNKARHDLLLTYLQDNYPDDPKLKHLIIDDLHSYTGWEDA